MGYFLYGLVRVVEAALFYILAFFVLKQLDIAIPSIGSQTFIIFVVIWPIVGSIVRPGLRTIPIIGEIFSLFDGLAMAALGKQTRTSEVTMTAPDVSKEQETERRVSEQSLSADQARSQDTNSQNEQKIKTN